MSRICVLRFTAAWILQILIKNSRCSVPTVRSIHFKRRKAPSILKADAYTSYVNLYLIFAPSVSMWSFNSNTSHVNLYPRATLAYPFFASIQIHPMLMLIFILLLTAQEEEGLHSNTSHVNLYRGFYVIGKRVTIPFKYIPC